MAKKVHLKIPLTVPKEKQKIYEKHYDLATQGSGRLFLFAGDQKIEHMNEDFCGKGIPAQCADPEHMFKIAKQGNVGVFATHLGLLARYGADYRDVPYLVKLNGKTNLVPTTKKDPLSLRLHTVCEVMQFQKETNIPVVGVGYTVFLGSEFEMEMLAQAAQMIYMAHQYGILAVLWMYPRGSAVKDERSAQIVAGAAGVAVSLGADFVKVNPPTGKTCAQRIEGLKTVVAAAGRTGVICSGGIKKDEKDFLIELSDQINKGGTVGCAIGRNIHQRTLKDAVAMCRSVAAIIHK